MKLCGLVAFHAYGSAVISASHKECWRSGWPTTPMPDGKPMSRAPYSRSQPASTPRLAGRSAAYNRAVMAKRSYGSGRLFVYKDKTGKESWYGSWRAGTRRVQRKIGPKRSQGGTSGLTRVQAERELRKRIDHDLVLATAERKTLADAGA